MTLSVRFLKRDKRWFEKVFDLHYEKIRNFLYYRTSDIEKAEDLTQDVYLKLWENRKKIEDKQVLSYLYKIANNLFINQYNREKLHFKFTADNNKRVSSDTPEFILEMKEFDLELQNTIADLPEKCRTIFLMNRIDKQTYNQIANNLSVSVKAVEKQMHKALSLLREKLSVKI
ncbi:RNA polymerase sigma-70 factor [Marinilabiliaceae bacterium JC017]|nr:RNA polymerase sigma-70 factor [Marinilabiliaceae bacterium JC017]